MQTKLTFWTKEISNKTEKEIVAQKLVSYARDGDVIGFGSGSTSYCALLALAQSGKNITAIPTSYEIDFLCQTHGIKTSSLSEHTPNWCFDGADEVDPKGWMIKGRGGAMRREKNVMSACHGARFILIDPSKMVDELGHKFYIPLEVTPEKLFTVEHALQGMGAQDYHLRQAKAKDGPVITEAGNLIIDLKLKTINQESDQKLKAIDGIVETGLFIGFDPICILPDSILERDE